MSQSLGKAAVDIVAESKPFLDAFKSLGGQVGKHAEDLGQKFSDGFARMFSVKNLVGMFTGGLTAGGLGLLLKQTVDFGDQMTKMSAETGIGVENLQRLRYVSDLSGVSLDGLTVALRHMAVQQTKSGTATGSMTDMLARAADEFAKMPDGAAKAAKAVEMFGRSGLDMIPMLNQGSKAIREQMGELDQLGGVMSTQTAKSAEDLNDNISRLKTGLLGLSYTAGSAVIPALTDITGGMVDWFKANQFVISQNMNIFVDKLSVSFTALQTSISALTNIGGQSFIDFSTIIRGAFLGLNLFIAGSLKIVNMQLELFAKPIVMLNSIAKKMGGVGQDGFVDGLMNVIKSLRQSQKAFELSSADIAHNWASAMNVAKNLGGDVALVLNGGGGGGKGTSVKQALEGTTPAWIADYEAMSMWASVAGQISGMVQSGALGQGILGTPENAIGGIGGPVQRDMSGLGGFSPGWSYEGGSPGLNPAETVGISLFGVPSLGSAVQSWMDTAAMVNTAPMSDLLNGILDQQAFFGMTWGEVAGNIGDSISAFFSDAVVNGFAGGAKKFIAALAGMFGQILSKMGTALIGQGTAEIVMGMAPPPFGPRPDLIAHGKLSIIKGALLAAGGGLITGLSSAIGGTSGGSSGESFQSGIARPYTTTQQATPINYNIGGKDVNIRIVAWDGESVKSWVDSGGDRIIQDAVSSGVKSNSKLREDIRHGISWNS